MRPIKRTIEQKDSTGCGIACVAMVCNRTYPHVRDKWKNSKYYPIKRGFRTEDFEIKQMLALYRKKARKANTTNWEKLRKMAIVAIKRGKDPRFFHWVVFDHLRGMVRDPQSSKEFRNPLTDKRLKLKMKYALILS